MRRFAFRLASVRSLRRLEERTSLIALREASLALEAAEGVVERVIAERREVSEALHRGIAGGFAVDALARVLVRSESLDDAMAHARRGVEAAHRAVRDARSNHETCRAARRALDQLEKRDRQRFEQERDREDRARMDEIAAVRFTRKDSNP